MVKKPVQTTGSGLIAITMLLIVVAIGLMVLDYRGQIPVVRDNLQTYLSLPIKRASSWPESLSRSIGNTFAEHRQLRAENEALKREVAWLKANLANQTVLEAEYRRLKNLFQSTANSTRPVMIAEVLDSHIDASKHQIEINKGLNAKVFEGQVVIDENGVVGQVTSVTPEAAIVSLITDDRQLIPVFVERNRLRMIARGSGELNHLEMEFVSKAADVRIGDKIVTSGLGNRYPRGYSIGVITEVSASPASEFMHITAKPLAALDRVLEVLLIAAVDSDLLEQPDDDANDTDNTDDRVQEENGK